MVGISLVSFRILLKYNFIYICIRDLVENIEKKQGENKKEEIGLEEQNVAEEEGGAGGARAAWRASGESGR